MIFRTYEHYQDDVVYNDLYINENINENENESICFICLENETCINKFIKLKNQPFFLKICNCDGIIHHNCLVIWYDTTKKCPICCREHFIKKSENILLEKFPILQIFRYCFFGFIYCFFGFLFFLPTITIIFMTVFTIIKINNYIVTTNSFLNNYFLRQNGEIY